MVSTVGRFGVAQVQNPSFIAIELFKLFWAVQEYILFFVDKDIIQDLKHDFFKALYKDLISKLNGLVLYVNLSASFQ